MSDEPTTDEASNAAGQVDCGVTPRDANADLARFLARTLMDWHEQRKKAIALPPEECKEALMMRFPIVQGTRMQMMLRKVGDQDFERANVKEAVCALLGHAG